MLTETRYYIAHPERSTPKIVLRHAYTHLTDANNEVRRRVNNPDILSEIDPEGYRVQKLLFFYESAMRRYLHAVKSQIINNETANMIGFFGLFLNAIIFVSVGISSLFGSNDWAYGATVINIVTAIAGGMWLFGIFGGAFTIMETKEENVTRHNTF